MAPYPVGNFYWLTRVTFQLPGEVVEPSLKGKQGLDQSGQREQLALQAADSPAKAMQYPRGR